MSKINNESEYRAIYTKIEELLAVVDDNTLQDDKIFIELNILSNLVADYEDVHYPIKAPELIDVLKLRMYEYGLTQSKLSELLHVSPSRISEYLSGKSEPTLKVQEI